MAASDEEPQFAILAPSGAAIPPSSVNVFRDRFQHQRLLGEVQRLRGRIALEERAIAESELESCGRHMMPVDEKSWHLLRLRRDGKVAGCARILVHPPDVAFPGLRLASSSVARSDTWSLHVKDAVETELERARLNGMTTIEPGGWVVDEDLRGTLGAVSLAISAFALAQVLGNCIGFMTATVKHGSSTILRRLGGSNLRARGEAIPTFFEPEWGCDMELLRFDTSSLNPRFEPTLAWAKVQLQAAPLISAEEPRSTRTPISFDSPSIYRPILARN